MSPGEPALVRVPTGATRAPGKCGPAGEAADEPGRPSPAPSQARDPREAGRARRGLRGERNSPRGRAEPYRRGAAASPWLRPPLTSSGASRSPTSAVCGSRPEVARRCRLRPASRPASARHLRPSLGNPGSEGRRRAGRSRAMPGAREGPAASTRRGFPEHARSGLRSGPGWAVVRRGWGVLSGFVSQPEGLAGRRLRGSRRLTSCPAQGQR